MAYDITTCLQCISVSHPHTTSPPPQVCWEKFGRYFEVDLKIVNIKEGWMVMDPQDAVDAVDENTICVCGILGSTYNGEFEDIKKLNDLLLEKNAQTG